MPYEKSGVEHHAKNSVKHCLSSFIGTVGSVFRRLLCLVWWSLLGLRIAKRAENHARTEPAVGKKCGNTASAGRHQSTSEKGRGGKRRKNQGKLTAILIFFFRITLHSIHPRNESPISCSSFPKFFSAFPALCVMSCFSAAWWHHPSLSNQGFVPTLRQQQHLLSAHEYPKSPQRAASTRLYKPQAFPFS